MKTLLVVDGRKVKDGRALELLRSHGVEFLYMPCWKTMIKVPEEVLSEAKALAETLEKMDETFKWKWVPSYLCARRALKEVLGAEKAKGLLSELSEVPGFGWIDDRDLEKEFIYHSYIYELHFSLDPTKRKMKAEELKQRLREWLLKLSKLVS